MHMAQKDDKPSRKKSSRKKKDEEKDELTESIEKKIEAAIRLNLEEAAKKRRMCHRQMETINSYIEEHLGCFVLLGYTIDGEPVSLVNAKTQKDSDSLGATLQRFITKYQEPQQPPQNPPLI
jgi:hypothetical protein